MYIFILEFFFQANDTTSEESKAPKKDGKNKRRKKDTIDASSCFPIKPEGPALRDRLRKLKKERDDGEGTPNLVNHGNSSDVRSTSVQVTQI